MLPVPLRGSLGCWGTYTSLAHAHHVATLRRRGSREELKDLREKLHSSPDPSLPWLAEAEDQTDIRGK